MRGGCDVGEELLIIVITEPKAGCPDTLIRVALAHDLLYLCWFRYTLVQASVTE